MAWTSFALTEPLLSADDKAGVAEICALLKRLSDNPELKHPTLKIAFVPDEEIGHGAALLDLEKAWCGIRLR